MDNRSLSHSVSWMPLLSISTGNALCGMEEGPPRSPCRWGLQNTYRCSGQKPGCWAYKKRRKKSSAVCRRAERKWRTDEASLRLTSAAKTVVLCGWREEPIGNLFTGWAAAGVEVTGMRQQAHKGNRRVLPCNVEWKMQADISASMKVRMCMAGAEESVVVLKLV